MQKRVPSDDLKDGFKFDGWKFAQTLAPTPEQAGNALRRANLMMQAANLDLALTMLLPAVNIKIAVDEFLPDRQDATRVGMENLVQFGRTMSR
jgi:hypothetical protein